MGDNIEQNARIGHNRPPNPSDARTAHFDTAFRTFRRLVFKVVGHALYLPSSGAQPDSVVEDVASEAWIRVWRSGYVRDTESHFYRDGEAIPLTEGSPTYQSARANVLVQTRLALLDYFDRQRRDRATASAIDLSMFEMDAIAEQITEVAEGPSWSDFEALFIQLKASDQDIAIMHTHYVGELSIRDTAEYLGLDRKTVENAIIRMKSILRKHFGVSES